MGHPRGQGEQVVYRIRVRGAIDARWSEWFHGLTICPQASGDTLLIGPVRDQAALHGLLAKIRDLGLPLILVERVNAAPGAVETARDAEKTRSRNGNARSPFCYAAAIERSPRCGTNSLMGTERGETTCSTR